MPAPLRLILSAAEDQAVSELREAQIVLDRTAATGNGSPYEKWDSRNFEIVTQ